jgi:hypothetical protein
VPERLRDLDPLVTDADITDVDQSAPRLEDFLAKPDPED